MVRAPVNNHSAESLLHKMLIHNAIPRELVQYYLVIWLHKNKQLEKKSLKDIRYPAFQESVMVHVNCK